MLSAALFQLDQTNVKTADTRHLGFWTQSGSALARPGVAGDDRAGARPEPDGQLCLSDNTLVKDATYQGKSLTQTPRHSASAWLDYRVAGGP